jgi:hypothetical protein
LFTRVPAPVEQRPDEASHERRYIELGRQLATPLGALEHDAMGFGEAGLEAGIELRDVGVAFSRIDDRRQNRGPARDCTCPVNLVASAVMSPLRLPVSGTSAFGRNRHGMA